MIRRIFGNTPFESATLEDVILPRHRPRVWDAKKMTSFSAKLHTIPEEFRSYFPCPTEMNSDGSMQQAVPKKKRGRPTGSTSIDPNERRTPKKTTKPTTIGSASNSIMKYFGSTVVRAIEQPSKSVARSLDMVSMNLDVQSLSIVDDIVEKKDFILPGIPHFDHRTVTTIPMISISPTIFILPPEIIKSA